MATNRLKYSSRFLSVTVSDGGALSGAPLRWGTKVGVAMIDATASVTTADFGPATYNLSVKGVDDSGNVAIAVGDAIYYVDADTPKLSRKASGYYAGRALATVTSGSTATIEVAIEGYGSLTGANGATAATGESVRITGGVGGTTGVGGAARLAGGAGGTTSGTGGAGIVVGGSATDGIGGAASVTGGAGAGTNRAGGAASITGGAAIGTATGGTVAATGGAGGATGAGGAVSVTGGAGGATSGAGGAVSITGGAPTLGAGGAVTITGAAGAGAGNNAGGDINLVPGAATGTAAIGEVKVNSSTAGIIPVNIEWLAASVDKVSFVATRAYRVKAITARPTVAGTDVGAVTAVVNKAASGTAITAGTALHTGTINLKGTADTIQSLTLAAAANLEIAAGDAIGIDFTGVLTAATGVVTVNLVPV